ncbi:transcriptional regulator [Ferribacterium limneticum]|uniref:transcriptional regulator n=1 Tax=Ferribacterium limneticum TaxID=76259 RepID=UPI001CF989C1|nr:transcriptional regulator [Ferribacterium limneticum]UCV29054.1 transcriptional regulator [Ferribacterium limneticum]UCV32972.1 transcriptional regulator [Ferribacterium limneticum]
MNTDSVLTYLKKYGQLRDSEIAAGTGFALTEVRDSLRELSGRGDISLCSMTVFENGKPTEGLFSRVSGYFPKPAPGRKPGVKS